MGWAPSTTKGIREMVEGLPPPVEPDSVDYIARALKDPVMTRFFTRYHARTAVAALDRSQGVANNVVPARRVPMKLRSNWQNGSLSALCATRAMKLSGTSRRQPGYPQPLAVVFDSPTTLSGQETHSPHSSGEVGSCSRSTSAETNAPTSWVSSWMPATIRKMPIAHCCCSTSSPNLG